MTEKQRRELRRWLTQTAADVIDTQIGRADPGKILASDDDRSATSLEWCSSVAHVGCLPPHQRHVFELRVRDDMRYADIAARLNLHLGTVHSRLARARARIRDLRESERPDDQDRSAAAPSRLVGQDPSASVA
ncbi:MAG: sigma factor-like helix-turn-helix DNA-binding protein [bacterium]